jgi:hypothetical protein
MSNTAKIPVFILGILILVSCQDKNAILSPSLSTEVQNALNAAIQDEYKAQAIYRRILNDFGDGTKPFSNVINAEIKHAEALANVMDSYNLSVPQNNFKVTDMPTFSTVKNACAAGAIAEVENIELYDEFLKLDLPSNVRNVFENNRRASLNNHLPAFNACK